MVRNRVAIVSLCVGMCFGSSVLAEQPVTFDLGKSSLAWVGKKVTGQHNGELKLKRAEGKVLPDGTVSGSFVIDMTSLSVADITDPKDNAKLAGHLKSDDFFSVAAFPEVTFTITSSTPIADAKPGEPNMTILGDLSVKGITAPVSFPAVVSVTDGKVRATGTATVDRTQFNVRYGSGKFFENLGNRLIMDDFQVQVFLEGAVASS